MHMTFLKKNPHEIQVVIMTHLGVEQLEKFTTACLRASAVNVETILDLNQGDLIANPHSSTS